MYVYIYISYVYIYIYIICIYIYIHISLSLTDIVLWWDWAGNSLEDRGKPNPPASVPWNPFWLACLQPWQWSLKAAENYARRKTMTIASRQTQTFIGPRMIVGNCKSLLLARWKTVATTVRAAWRPNGPTACRSIYRICRTLSLLRKFIVHMKIIAEGGAGPIGAEGGAGFFFVRPWASLFFLAVVMFRCWCGCILKVASLPQMRRWSVKKCRIGRLEEQMLRI